MILTRFIFQNRPNNRNAADVMIDVEERSLIEFLTKNEENRFDEFNDSNYSVEPPNASDSENNLTRRFEVTIYCFRITPAILVIFHHQVNAAENLENIVKSRDSCQFISLTFFH